MGNNNAMGKLSGIPGFDENRWANQSSAFRTFAKGKPLCFEPLLKSNPYLLSVTIVMHLEPCRHNTRDTHLYLSLIDACFRLT